MDVGGVRQVSRLAHDAFDSLELEGRGHLVGGRQVINQLGGDAGISEDGLHPPGVFLIILLHGLRVSCGHPRGQRGGGEQSDQPKPTPLS